MVEKVIMEKGVGLLTGEYLTLCKRWQEHVFSGCNIPPHSNDKGPNLEMATRRPFHQQVKVMGYSSGLDIFKVPRCHLWRKMSSPSGSQKSLSKLVSQNWELKAFFCNFDLILNSKKWLCYQKYVNQTTLLQWTL